MEERLQKYMASCGVASRRKCEEFIIEGKVKVNGKVVNTLGEKINGEKDVVEFQGKRIFREEKKIYIALNKPIKYVTTVKDEKDRKTVLDLINVEERIYPIGRLDFMTSGLLLLTNDGEVFNKIIHPRTEKSKTYIAKIKGVPSKREIEHFKNGVDIGGYITAKSEFKIIKSEHTHAIVEIKIHEGKNRQIRKMCDKINHPVVELKRISIGKIKLGNLKEGTWRYLEKNEIDYLKSL